MQHRIDTISVNDNPMEVFMYLPDGEGPHPGIVLAMHIPVGHTGIENDTFTMKTAERYAESGFAVAIPFIFHWWPKSDDIQIKELKKIKPEIKAKNNTLKFIRGKYTTFKEK